MPLRIVDTSDISSEDRNIPAVLQYDAVAGRFRLKHIVNNSAILTSAVEDNDLDDSFITQLETEIDTDNITTRRYDGGSF
jgi:hypothetical protein